VRNYSLRYHEFDETELEGKQSPVRRFLPEFRDLTESEHPFSRYQFVRQYDTMLIEPPIYLSAVLTDFRIAGGGVQVKHFDDVSQLQQLAEPVIFNCTGLGARALFNDQELTPKKGQLTVLLPQPRWTTLPSWKTTSTCFRARMESCWEVRLRMGSGHSA